MVVLTRTIRRSALAIMLLVGALVWIRPEHTAQASASGIVVSQVYGGGGNTGAPYTNDFIELFNASSATVNLSGMSVQYASATGTGNFGANTGQMTPLPPVFLAPGQYLLIQEAGGAVGSPLPPTDVVDATPINMSGTAGKVALANTTASLGCNGGSTPCSPAQLALIVDLVGYGGANFFEGPAPAPTLTNTTAALRAVHGCTDTDNNSADFSAGAPTPRNMLSAVDPCPTGDVAPSVSGTQPANGASGVALDANIEVDFSEDVTVSDGWFSLTCSSSGAHTASASGGPASFTLDPDVDFVGSENCTLTVYAAQVSDLDTLDPPDHMTTDASFTFTTSACGTPATLIHDIQGSGLSSPLVGSIVSVEGVVVGDYQTSSFQSGFFVQEESTDADSDPATSEGLFVFDGASPSVNVAVGDRVRATGRVTEFGTPSLTELTNVSGVTVCGTEALPTPQAVTLPFTNASDAEPYEDMLVTLPQTLVATEVFSVGRFGEIALATQRHPQPTHIAAPGDPANAVAAANALDQLILDDGRTPQNPDPTPYLIGAPPNDITLRDGDSITGLIGVMHQAFGTYRIQPFDLGSATFSADNPRPAAPEPVGGTLRVASFNVLNFFNGDGLGGGFPTPRGANTQVEYDRQKAKTVAAITALNADVIGLMEMENDASGPNSAIQDLVNGLNAATAPGTYSYIDTGILGTDQIKVAILYKPARVTPVGPWATITTGTFNGFSRPPIAQVFEENSGGERFIYVVNHLKSKSSCPSSPSDPDADQGDQQGCWNAKRVQSANELLAWLATDPTGSGDPDVLMMGDFNSYAMEDPIVTLEAGGFTDMAKYFHGTDAYSYVFSGAAGYLDYALGSASIVPRVTGVTDWHINTDEPPVLDYNMEFKSATQQTYNQGTPYRASDHDPVLVGLLLGDPAVSVNPSPYDFGNQRLNVTSAPHTFTITNSGSAPLVLEAVSASGPFAVSSDSCSGGTLLPGASCAVDVTFTPSALGPANGTLTIPSNAATSPDHVDLSGTGVAPSVLLNPGSLTFGVWQVGSTSLPQTVTLTNTGTDTLNIGSLSASADFTSSACSPALAPGDSCVISVQFAPTTAGALTGSLTVMSDALSSPDMVNLSGTAVDPGSNLLLNGSFEINTDGDATPDSWSTSNLKGSDGLDCTSSAAEGHCTVTLSGHGSNLVKQSVAVSGNAGDSHTLTFWARGEDLGGSGHSYRVRVIVKHADNSEETYEIELPSGTTPWTQYALTFVTLGSYTDIQVQIMGGKATGTVWLDDFILQ